MGQKLIQSLWLPYLPTQSLASYHFLLYLQSWILILEKTPGTRKVCLPLGHIFIKNRTLFGFLSPQAPLELVKDFKPVRKYVHCSKTISCVSESRKNSRNNGFVKHFSGYHDFLSGSKLLQLKIKSNSVLQMGTCPIVSPDIQTNQQTLPTRNV